MNALQATLTEQFGAGDYLTNSGLDWNNPITVEPKAVQGAHSIPDRLIDLDDLPYGEGALSVGFNRSALSYAYDAVSVFGQVLKRPGETVHRVPRQLACLTPVIEQIATEEFKLSAFARDKYCRMTLRALPLRENVKQVAENVWHAHPIPTTLNARQIEEIDLDADALSVMPHISAKVMQSEYLYSDCTGTLTQTERAPFRMTMNHKYTNGRVLVTKPPQTRQAEPHEILRMTSHTFHAAATPKPEEIGRTRTMLLVYYTATHAVEDALRARQPRVA